MLTNSIRNTWTLYCLSGQLRRRSGFLSKPQFSREKASLQSNVLFNLDYRPWSSGGVLRKMLVEKPHPEICMAFGHKLLSFLWGTLNTILCTWNIWAIINTQLESERGEGESRSVLSDSATPWTIQSMEFSRPECCIAVPFSRGSSQPMDRTQVSRIAGRFFTN